jgi:hypothetical protein
MRRIQVTGAFGTQRSSLRSITLAARPALICPCLVTSCIWDALDVFLCSHLFWRWILSAIIPQEGSSSENIAMAVNDQTSQILDNCTGNLEVANRRRAGKRMESCHHETGSEPSGLPRGHCLLFPLTPELVCARQRTDAFLGFVISLEDGILGLVLYSTLESIKTPFRASCEQEMLVIRAIPLGTHGLMIADWTCTKEFRGRLEELFLA